MHKLLLVVGVVLTAFLLYGCTPSYNLEAGLYELYEMTGDVQIEDFEYYTIELFEDGDLIVKSKGSALDSEAYEAIATYRIRSNEITITTKVGFTNLKEVYDYIDGEIHMFDVEVPGYDLTYTAKFRRAE